jgi:ribosomal protein L18E
MNIPIENEVHTIAQLETILRSLSLVIPTKRLLLKELVSSTNNTLADVVTKSLYQKAEKQQLIVESPINRYWTFWSKHKFINISYSILMIFKNWQHVLEILASKISSNVQEKVVKSIELIKFCLRLFIVTKTKQQLLNASNPQRYYSPNNVDVSKVYRGSRTKKVYVRVGALPDDGMEYLLSKSLTEYNAPNRLMTSLTGKQLLLEYVYLLRPLVYCFLSYKQKGWLPWVLSLTIDSLVISKKDQKTELDRIVYMSRLVALKNYLLRNPFYDAVTKYGFINLEKFWCA